MGVKICPECGGKVSESRDTCIHCGYIFTKEETKETKKCPDCGADIDISLKECPDCGYLFVDKEQPKKEEKHSKKEEHITNVTCSSCGSGDLEQLDNYTYRCKHCSCIVKVKKPDVNVYNINSFAGDSKTADVPVYQVVKDLDEEVFVRNAVLHLFKSENVSPIFLENFKVDKSMVSLAYITYVTKEYSVDVSYTCDIGTDHRVSYYDKEGNEHYRTETRWEPFSGSSHDGGDTTFCAFGDETEISSSIPYFYSDIYEFEQFKEVERYPLKQRADRSADESAKRYQIGSLEFKCRTSLPGDYNRNFRVSGRCSLSDAKAFYYVPAFTLNAMSNNHKVTFSCVANQKGKISHLFEESSQEFNQGDETTPKVDKAKGIFKKTSFGVISLICVIVFPILLGLSVIFSIALGNGYLMIGTPIYLGGLIAVCVLRRKTINNIHHNLVYKYKERKLEACKKCLASNNLAPLTEDEIEQLL